MASLLVSEVFGPTVQGEGPASGHLACFVRLGGCNLACVWCDAAYTWDARHFDLRKELSRVPWTDVLGQLMAKAPRLVILTGGEPLLQQGPGYGLVALLEALRGHGVEVHVETNGTVVPSAEVAELVSLFVVSPKLDHAGMSATRTIRGSALSVFAELSRKGRAALKVVCTNEADVEATAKLARTHGFAPEVVWVMPEGVTTEQVVARQAELIESVLRLRVNLSTRLHILTYGNVRGDLMAVRTGAHAVAELLACLGYDVEANGLADTPRRVATALAEMTSGEHIDPGHHLAKVFDVKWSTDEMIVLRGIEFASLCEHHLLPFTGHATVAYIPNEGAGVVGLSKLARVVEGFARRLQVQERLTTQVADCIESNLDTRGVAVTITAHHTCMSLRGVRKDGALMITSVTRGLFRDDARARAEFMALAG